MIYRVRAKKSGWGYTNLPNFHKIEFGKRVFYFPHWKELTAKLRKQEKEYMATPFWAPSKFPDYYMTWKGRMLSIFDTPEQTKVRHVLNRVA